MADRLPSALVNRFAHAVRDVLWYRDRVSRFFERAGVPRAILRDLEKDPRAPTVKKCFVVVELLEQTGTEGTKVLQRLFREIAEWDDYSHLEPEKQSTARKSQQALKSEIRAYADRQRYVERIEREQQREREAFGRPRPLDHVKLQAFRDEFDKIYALSDKQARGNKFEKLLNDVFDYYCTESRGPFTRAGEQVDGHFHYDGHDYLCEIRWRDGQTNAADISTLRDRAASAFGGDVRALFISFNGFTKDCLNSLQQRAAQERVILMDGVDLRAVLSGDIAFDILLREKLARAVREQKAFVPARDIVLERIHGSVMRE